MKLTTAALCLLFVFGANANDVLAQVVVFGTRDGGAIGGLQFGFDDLIRYDLGSNTASLYRPEFTSSLQLTTNIDALDIASSGEKIFSARGTEQLFGTVFLARDLIRSDANSGELTRAFRFERNINGLDWLPNGNVLLSATLDAEIGGLEYHVGDVVEYNPATDTATVFFSHEIFLTGEEGGNFDARPVVDAVQLLENGNLLISTTNSVQIGSSIDDAVTLFADSVYEYNLETGSVSTFFDGAVFTGNLDIKAFAILPAEADPEANPEAEPVVGADLVINFSSTTGRGDKLETDATAADFIAVSATQLDSRTVVFDADPDIPDVGGGVGGGWNFFGTTQTDVAGSGLSVTTTGDANGFNAEPDSWTNNNVILDGYVFDVQNQSITFDGIAALTSDGDMIVVSVWGIGDDFGQNSDFSVSYADATTAAQSTLYNGGADRGVEDGAIPVVHFTFTADGIADSLAINVLGSGYVNAVSIAFVSSAGDFDENGVVDCNDLQGYFGNLGASVEGITGFANLDIDSDGTLSLDDAHEAIKTLVVTSNGIKGTFPGDFNCDGRVDVVVDAFTLVGSLGGLATSYEEGDASFDGSVDILTDAFILIGNLGESNESE